MKTIKALSFTVLLMLIQLAGYAQPCTLRCPSNIVVKADNGQEGAIVYIPSETFGTECGNISYSPASGTFFRIGSHSVIVTSSTGEKCSFTVTVTDNESPVLSELTLSLDRLWPASNRMRKVRVDYTATDNAQELTSVLSVSSNDNVSVIQDWEIINDHMLRLSGSRLANGDPRIYLITVTSTDVAGNKMTRTTSIAVSKTMIAMKPESASIGVRD